MTKKKILIADSDPMIMDFLAELFTGQGHYVVKVDDGREALRKVKDEVFHLIVVDVNMPCVRGKNLYLRLDELRKDKHIPMVIMTGSGLEPSMVEFINRDRDTFITKPSEVSLILERINECLAGS